MKKITVVLMLVVGFALFVGCGGGNQAVVLTPEEQLLIDIVRGNEPSVADTSSDFSDFLARLQGRWELTEWWEGDLVVSAIILDGDYVFRYRDGERVSEGEFVLTQRRSDNSYRYEVLWDNGAHNAGIASIAEYELAPDVLSWWSELGGNRRRYSRVE